MPNWEAQFREHDLFAVLGRVEQLLDATRIMAEDLSPVANDDHSRLAYVVGRLRRALDEADPLSVSMGHVSGAHNNLTRVEQELQNFRSTRNQQHLAQANTHAENALVQADLLPKIRTEQDLEALHEAVVSFRRSLGQHLRRVEDESSQIEAGLQQLKASLESVRAEIQQQKHRLDDAISRFESQFSESENERRKEFQQYIDKIQQQLSQFEQRFLSSQENRQEKFSSSLQEQDQKLLAQLKKMEEAQKNQEAYFSSAVQDFIGVLEERKREAEAIVGAIAQTGMVGGYQKVANNEKRAMRFWQGVTVVAMLGLVVLMLLLVPESNTDGSWIAFARRAFAALGLGGLAAYAAREAAKHGEKERINRQLELEIASVGPFLATIPKEDQDMIKKKIADRTFGQGAQPVVVGDHVVTTNGLVEITRFVVSELLKRAK